MLTIKRIHALPLQLANQIAAGEVIERPASVIKELVENSLDAAATTIEVTIEGAGSQLIQVQDNGVGIHPQDLHLALSRHATSKIASSEQLSQIASLGFRGEALPSISSVSNMSLTSRQSDSECGWQIQHETDSAKPVSHPLGTTVAVRDLFFNLPARRRFLRSARTEQQQILTTLQRLALSRFDVAFQCVLNGQSKLNLPIAHTDEQRLTRIGKICGQAFVKHAVAFEQQFDLLQLHGWLGSIDAHRPQTDQQYFFINGRVIRDRLISQVIRQAYAELIPAGRHPAYVLYLTIPLDRVDVNVHPTKHEVRFRETRLIHGLIHRAISDILHQQAPTATLAETPPARPQITEAASTYHSHALSTPKQHYPAAAAPQAASTTTIQLIQLLHQRFALLCYQQKHFLLDLPAAMTAARKQQFQQAVQQLPLQSRPILVPLRFPATVKQQQTVLRQQDLLKALGFTFQQVPDALTINSIPLLLASIDLNTLVQHLLTSTGLAKGDVAKLTHDLSVLLKTTETVSPEQAEQWLLQNASTALGDPHYCRELDLLTLGSLFSGD